MGRLTRTLGAALLALGFSAALASETLGFDGFGEATADSTYGSEIRFGVELEGEAPDRLELLLTTPGSQASFVAPVATVSGQATYVWDTSLEHVTPNTPVTYRWRATTGGEVELSTAETILYEDDRPGLDWSRARMGEATVHWYGGAEGQARRFGELTATGVDRAEALLGTELAGPVDVFVYASQEDFFGALGPGAREWTGAAAFSELRTIFMWLGGGSQAYLETAMLHEVTHIVFHDATDNPFHEPARWLNEGVATWSEDGEPATERAIVESEVGEGLFAFEAIAEQFPIGERGGRLSYAQGTMLVDLIVERFGEEAIAEIMAAYRDGASDDEALEAGTGIPTPELYEAFFAGYGIEPPRPIEPERLAPSNVDLPPAGEVDTGGGPVAPPPVPVPGEPAGGRSTDDSALVVGILGLASAAALLIAAAVARRAARRAAS